MKNIEEENKMDINELDFKELSLDEMDQISGGDSWDECRKFRDEMNEKYKATKGSNLHYNYMYWSKKERAQYDELRRKSALSGEKYH